MKTSIPVASLALLPVLLAALPRPFPDSWLPFQNQRVVSASGQRYVVIKKKKALQEFVWVAEAG